jgi:hypothetical protein
MRFPAKWLAAFGAAMLFAGSTAAVERRDDVPSAHPIEPTQIEDWEAFDRIVNNRGMTVQWLDFDATPRGEVKAVFENRTLSLQGEQRSNDRRARVTLSGTVARVTATEFVFRGNIIIADTPDEGRWCSEAKEWRFAITQNRKYWRLREFEWCDGLTDYIDIYF